MRKKNKKQVSIGTIIVEEAANKADDGSTKQKAHLFKRMWNKIINGMFPESSKRPFIMVAVITLAVFIIATVFENIAILEGKFLSTFFGYHLQRHLKGHIDGVYVLYYLVLFSGVFAYVASTLYIIVQKDTKGWCGVSILISVVFLVAVDEWLSITMEYDKPATLYNNHMVCFICIATIFTALSAARLSAIIKGENETTSKK